MLKYLFALNAFLASASMLIAAPYDDAMASYNRGDYKQALKIIAEAVNNTPAPSDERFNLLMLKGDCLLRAGERAFAIDTYNFAARATDNAKLIPVARATAALVKKSRNNAYKPLSPPNSEPIDILAPDSRKKAFASLFADTQNSLKPKVAAAQRATTLPPTMELVEPLLEQGAMEYLANGNADITRQTLSELGEHARKLMSEEIRANRMKLEQYSNMANSITGSDAGFGRRGLQIPEQRQVRDLISYLHQIQTTAQRARGRAKELGFDGSVWEPIIADCADAMDLGEAVLGVTP
jgi:tetratricopeptide (TPR) repeat protein